MWGVSCPKLRVPREPAAAAIRGPAWQCWRAASASRRGFISGRPVAFLEERERGCSVSLAGG